MPGESSILDMIIRYRNNMNQLRKRRLFKNGKNYFHQSKDAQFSKDTKLDMSPASEQQLNAARKLAKKGNKTELFLTITLLLVISTMLLFLGRILYADMQNTSDFTRLELQAREELKIKAEKEKQSEYLADLTKGDNYLSENKWNSAIYRYTKALECYPTSYDASYRLALAYCYSCQEKEKYCEEASELLRELIYTYATQTELLALKAMQLYAHGDSLEAFEIYKKIDLIQSQEVKAP